MPTLNWIGKDAVIRHHADVPFRLLEADEELSHVDTKTPENGTDGNLILQGDNLHALKALLPKYAGKVKCIYIDPPYNTGNEGWEYNDNVNDPEINKWLGQVVGKEAEDLSRHDKWLCMMYPRMVLLKQFLSEDGAIFVSIDDNEIASLRLLMDEIFGKQNFVSTVIWNMMDSPKNSARYLSEDHEYVVLYTKNKPEWVPKPLPRTEEMTKRYKNPDKDPRGPWLLGDLAARNFYAQGRYPIETPSKKIIKGPPSGSYWRVNEQKFWALNDDNRIWWGKTGANRPGIKRFLSEVKDGVVPRTLWPWKEAGSTRHSKQELSQILALGTSSDLFVTPKPSSLIQRILQIASDKDSIILDSYAGSGTTAHAVLKQNEADGGNRKFILVEMEEKIATEITSERVRRVAGGYTNPKGEEVEGLGGGFQYCRLSEEPLFNEFGDIRDDVSFDELADFVWFAETGVGYTEASDGAFLGAHGDVGIYLLFNGILGDIKPAGGNILTTKILEQLPAHDGPKVIYAAATRLGSAALQRENIIFKQTPYAIDV